MVKNNQMLAKLEAKYEAKYRLMFQHKFHTMEQMFQDASMITAHEVCGLGPRNATKFSEVFRETVNEMAQITLDDAKDDPDFWYAREKVDTALRGICGDSFQPWEERY